MQLAGPGVFGPPKDHGAALAVLREAVASGVDHIDTSDFYGPHVTNQLICEALAPYPATLTIVTKVGAVRGPEGSWDPAQDPASLRAAVRDNLRHLGLERLDLVNFRVHDGGHGRSEGSIAAGYGALAELQAEGLIAGSACHRTQRTSGFRSVRSISPTSLALPVMLLSIRQSGSVLTVQVSPSSSPRSWATAFSSRASSCLPASVRARHRWGTPPRLADAQ